MHTWDNTLTRWANQEKRRTSAPDHQEEADEVVDAVEHRGGEVPPLEVVLEEGRGQYRVPAHMDKKWTGKWTCPSAERGMRMRVSISQHHT